MAYRDKVSELAALRNISNNPGLQENDLGIGGLHFYDNRGMRTRIIAGKMNRGARLFFEHHAKGLGNDKRWVISNVAFSELQILGRDYFAELLDDVRDRPLLRAFMEGDSVVIFWKVNPNWLKDFNQGLDEEMVPDFD